MSSGAPATDSTSVDRRTVARHSGGANPNRGVTRSQCLYTLGLHWMHTFKSGVLFGVGDDAAHIADHIEARRRQS